MSLNEIQAAFFNENIPNLQILLNNIKPILSDFSEPIKNESSYIMLTILNEFCINEQKVDEYLSNAPNAEIAAKTKELLANFLVDEKENVINYFKYLNQKKKDSYLRLKNIEWKFIGLSTSEDFEKGVVAPKILVKLFFNDGSEKVFESDFSTMKKLQEEIEECLSGFNSTYTRRIEYFAK